MGIEIEECGGEDKECGGGECRTRRVDKEGLIKKRKIKDLTDVGIKHSSSKNPIRITAKIYHASKKLVIETAIAADNKRGAHITQQRPNIVAVELIKIKLIIDLSPVTGTLIPKNQITIILHKKQRLLHKKLKNKIINPTQNQHSQQPVIKSVPTL